MWFPSLKKKENSQSQPTFAYNLARPFSFSPPRTNTNSALVDIIGSSWYLYGHIVTM
jgi:hypothetical protein